MDRKELYLNARKAYRLVYEVQDSIVEIVEYIRARIDYIDCAGKPLFSNALGKRKGIDENYVNDNIGNGMWSWDYFPTFMYMYYFLTPPTETEHCCFSIIQVMDDGFSKLPDTAAPPSTKDFGDPTDSKSYLLFAFSIWEKNQRAIWFDYDGTNEIDDEKNEILRITEDITKKGHESYIMKTVDAFFIATKVNLEGIGSKAEADETLQKFSMQIFDNTEYQLLREDL